MKSAGMQTTKDIQPQTFIDGYNKFEPTQNIDNGIEVKIQLEELSAQHNHDMIEMQNCNLLQMASKQKKGESCQSYSLCEFSQLHDSEHHNKVHRISSAPAALMKPTIRGEKTINYKGARKELISIIKHKDEEDLKNFLSSCSYPVKITPKLGCDKKFHSENIIVNSEDDFGKTPLLVSCENPSRNAMTMLLLKYGANPNPKSCAVQSLEHSPLIKVSRTLNQNQNEENEVVVKELLIHGADLMLAVDSLCSVLKTSYHNSHDVMMILTTLVKPKFFSQTKDPIRTAHHINHELTKVIKIKEEYQENCEKMILLGREFTYAFLDACTSSWDARRLLFNSNFIEDALQKEEKKFLSHPLCQEIILTEFYGSDKFKSLGQQILLIFEGISAALSCCYHVIFLPLHLIKCGGSWKYKYSPLYYNVRTLNTAYYSFLCDAFNHMVLLVILPYVATSIPKTYKAVKDEHIDTSAISYIQKQRGSLTTPTFLEITLWLCILSRILTEVHQIATKGYKKYSSNFWNFVDVLMCISLISASGSRLYCLTAYNSTKVLENQDLLEDLKLKTTWAIYIYSKQLRTFLTISCESMKLVIAQ